MTWKNITRHGEIVGAMANIGCFRLSVHHYIQCGDTWFVSCSGIFDKQELGKISLNAAKVMAAAGLQLKLEQAIKVITNQPYFPDRDKA